MYHGITYADEYYDEETRGMLTVRYWKAYMKYGIIAYPKHGNANTPERCARWM